jgi:putative peptidoglycan lipid II flippase
MPAFRPEGLSGIPLLDTEPTNISPPAADTIQPAREPANAMAESGIARAAVILGAGNIASRLLGLVRETVKANLFGASGLLSAFTVATYVPLGLFELIIGGMVNSSLVPVFSDYARKERHEELWGVVSTFLSVATAVLLLIVIAVELFAPQIAWLVGAHNFEDPALTAVSIRLMRLGAPAILFLSLSSILTGVLYALKRFTVPAFIGATFNGAIVLTALLWPDEIVSLVWGMLIGSVLQIALQLPALHDARLRWRFDWRHPAIGRILFLYSPILAGLAVNQVAVALSYNLATRTGDESVTFMGYATTLYQFPLGLVVTALSIATLPTLAQQAGHSITAFKRTLADGIRMVLTLILPATAGLFALAIPIVALLFEHGRFTPQDTLQTALVLRVYLFGLPFAAVDQMLVFASYARKDTWRPALVGVVTIVIYLAVAVILLRPLGLLSLMVADAVKHVAHTMIMLWLLQRHLGGLAGHGVAASVIKSLAAAAVTGAVAYGVTQVALITWPLLTFTHKLAVVVVSGSAAGVVYMLMVLLLNIQEIKSLPAMLLRK